MIRKARYIIAEGYVPFPNMALEEYLLLQVGPDECILYLWQNKNTVVIGRNQNCWKECRVAQLEESGGYVARRLSGGGAVFHDTGNLNFTFLARKAAYDVPRQTEVILRAVSSFGIDARRSGRNDITVDGRKFSGNAFYQTGDRCYHHGTILINADIPMLSHYLHVSAEKLRSKGVDSVKSRVVNLCDINPDITVEKMKARLITAFEEVYGVTPEPIGRDEINQAELERLTRKFSDDTWRFGRPIPFTCQLEKRFAWGEIQLQLHVHGGQIVEAAVFSDAMNAELISRIPAALQGVFFSSDLLSEALGQISCADEAERDMTSDIKNLIKEQEF